MRSIHDLQKELARKCSYSTLTVSDFHLALVMITAVFDRFVLRCLQSRSESWSRSHCARHRAM